MTRHLKADDRNVFRRQMSKRHQRSKTFWRSRVEAAGLFYDGIKYRKFSVYEREICLVTWILSLDNLNETREQIL